MAMLNKTSTSASLTHLISLVDRDRNVIHQVLSMQNF